MVIFCSHNPGAVIIANRDPGFLAEKRNRFPGRKLLVNKREPFFDRFRISSLGSIENWEMSLIADACAHRGDRVWRRNLYKR